MRRPRVVTISIILVGVALAANISHARGDRKADGQCLRETTKTSQTGNC